MMCNTYMENKIYTTEWKKANNLRYEKGSKEM